MTEVKNDQVDTDVDAAAREREKQAILEAHAASQVAAAPVLDPATTPGQGVVLTERAAREVKRIIDEEGLPESTCLRVGAKGGGCSGFSYVLDFDKKGRTEFDSAYVSHGVTVLIDKKSEFVMGGTIVDFNGDLLNRGFVFQNPAASGTCGCGTSFTV